MTEENTETNTAAGLANRTAFDTWLDRFFADYYARRPVNATFTGIHEHDESLPDCGSGSAADAISTARAMQNELSSIPQDGLTEAQRHDRQMADGFLTLQAWEAEAPQFQAGNPSFYTGEAVFCVISLFQRDSEPLGERVSSAISRMKALPEFYAVARDNVTEAPHAWTERAAREAHAAVEYFGHGLETLARDRNITEPAFFEAAEIARSASQQHALWLETVLTRHPNDHYTSGQEAFDRYLHLGHCLPEEQDASTVIANASDALHRAREEMEARARDIDSGSTWQELLASLADFHPTVEGYYPAFGNVWDSMRALALEHDLVTWPEYPITYGPIPESDRKAAEGLYYLYYRCPPPYGKKEIHRYVVPPIEPEMPVEEQERKLRATNDAAIKLNHVIHHGGLGHHVQNWNAFRADSRVGQMAGVDCASRVAMFCAGTLVEGWACYATELMEEIGALTDLETLSESQTRLRMAARAYVDAALHSGQMTLQEAAEFYEQEAAMPAAAAMGEAVKNSMFPGAAMMYLSGTSAIHELRKRLEEREGDAFSLQAFHDRFLSYGAIPVSLIARSMSA